jgi:hypothetical protein
MPRGEGMKRDAKKSCVVLRLGSRLDSCVRIAMVIHHRSVTLRCNIEFRINKRREVTVCALVYYTKH